MTTSKVNYIDMLSNLLCEASNIHKHSLHIYSKTHMPKIPLLSGICIRSHLWLFYIYLCQVYFLLKLHVQLTTFQLYDGVKVTHIQ